MQHVLCMYVCTFMYACMYGYMGMWMHVTIVHVKKILNKLFSMILVLTNCLVFAC